MKRRQQIYLQTSPMSITRSGRIPGRCARTWICQNDRWNRSDCGARIEMNEKCRVPRNCGYESRGCSMAFKVRKDTAGVFFNTFETSLTLWHVDDVVATEVLAGADVKRSSSNTSKNIKIWRSRSLPRLGIAGVYHKQTDRNLEFFDI